MGIYCPHVIPYKGVDKLLNLIKNYGIYLRVSTDMQDSGHQRRACNELAEILNIIPYDIYSDTMSGSIWERAGFQRMLRDIERKAINGIIVFSQDRLTREPMDILKFMAIVEVHNLEIHSVMDSIKLDSTLEQMMTTMKSYIHKMEREAIIKRVKSGIKNYKAKHGRWGRISIFSDGRKVQQLKYYWNVKEIHNYTSLAKLLSCSPLTISKYVKQNPVDFQ